MADGVDVIIKAIQDAEFKSMLFSDPDRALSGFRLTERERTSLKDLEERTFESSVARIDEETKARILRGGNIGDTSATSLDHPVVQIN